MGVDYSAVIAIGKTFYDKYEAESFLEQNNILEEDDREYIEEHGLLEWLYDNDKVEGDCLDAYRGDYYFIGYEISCSDPTSFKQTFDNGMELWKEYFPSVEPDIIKTVKVY